MKNHVEVWENLNDLIQINRDRIKGYEKAIEEAGTNTYISDVFRKNMELSERYVQELNKAVISIQHHPETTGTVLGALHRTWMEVKNAFGTADKEDILEECKFGDKSALEAYDSVLNSSDLRLSVAIRAILQKQRTGIQMAYNEISMLEEAYDAVEA